MTSVRITGRWAVVVAVLLALAGCSRSAPSFPGPSSPRPAGGIVVVSFEEPSSPVVGFIDPSSGRYSQGATLNISPQSFGPADSGDIKLAPDWSRYAVSRPVGGATHAGWVDAQAKFVDVTADARRRRRGDRFRRHGQLLLSRDAGRPVVDFPGAAGPDRTAANPSRICPPMPAYSNAMARGGWLTCRGARRSRRSGSRRPSTSTCRGHRSTGRRSSILLTFADANHPAEQRFSRCGTPRRCPIRSEARTDRRSLTCVTTANCGSSTRKAAAPPRG